MSEKRYGQWQSFHDSSDMAECATKVLANCPHCGILATHSYRLSEETETVVFGEKDKYEPRWRICYQMGNILTLR